MTQLSTRSIASHRQAYVKWIVLSKDLTHYCSYASEITDTSNQFLLRCVLLVFKPNSIFACKNRYSECISSFIAVVLKILWFPL